MIPMFMSKPSKGAWDYDDCVIEVTDESGNKYMVNTFAAGLIIAITNDGHPISAAIQIVETSTSALPGDYIIKI